MLTAVNENTRMVQELMATEQGELIGAERAAEVAFVNSSSQMPLTGKCRCLGVVVFASDAAPGSLRVMDGSPSTPIMETFAITGWWGSMILPRGVASAGNLIAWITGEGAYGYVYYVRE